MSCFRVLIVAFSCFPLAAQTDEAAAAIGLRGANFRNIDMRGVNLAGADVRNAVFQDAKLAGACLWQARIDGADFRGATGLTPQQIASATWHADRPPKLGTDLYSFRRFLKKKALAGMALPGTNWWLGKLDRFDLTGTDLRGSTFIAASLRGASLQRANLAGCCFAGADLSGADLRGAAGFSTAHLLSARWDVANPPKVDDALRVSLKAIEKLRLPGLQLQGSDFWNRDLAGTNFVGANLSGSTFFRSNLRGAIFRDADLTGTYWAGADVTGADLRGSKVPFARLIGARWDAAKPPVVDRAMLPKLRRFMARKMPNDTLRGMNLWGVDLSRGNFNGADLRGSLLIDANLREATLRDAELADVDLTGADLSGADLRGAKGITIGQLLSARWDAVRPPQVSPRFALFKELWPAKQIVRRAMSGAILFDRDLKAARFRGSALANVAFVFGSLRGADLRDADLRGAVFHRTDISGADFRGAEGITRRLIVSARWNPDDPPVFNTGLHAIREFTVAKRFEFSLRGISLQGPEPAGLRGPLHDEDEVASFRPATPPRLGMRRLRQLIRERKFGRLRIEP